VPKSKKGNGTVKQYYLYNKHLAVITDMMETFHHDNESRALRALLEDIVSIRKINSTLQASLGEEQIEKQKLQARFDYVTEEVEKLRREASRLELEKKVKDRK